MSEGSQNEPPNPGRRNLFKRVAQVGVAAAGLALGIKEIRASIEGIETSEAIFFPYYERHDRGIETANVRDDLDGFFREGSGAFPKAGEIDSLSLFLSGRTALPGQSRTENMDSSLLEKFSKTGLNLFLVMLIMGDSYLGIMF